MYFRLGASYPRKKLREHYPRKVRRISFVPTGDVESRILTSGIELTDSVTINKVALFSITDTVNLTDHLIKVIAETLSHNLSFTDTVSRKAILKRRVTDSLNLLSTASSYTEDNESLRGQLNLAQNVFLNHSHKISLTDKIDFTDNARKAGTVNISLTQQLVFQEGFIKKIIEGNEIIVGEVIPVLVEDFVRFNGNGVVLLPPPEFGDFESSVGSIMKKRSMSGGLTTYIKSTSRRKLQYNFLLWTNKAKELMSFYDGNYADFFTMTNWKGEQWRVKFQATPSQFTYNARGRCSQEQVAVTVELEGYQTA